jgi:hypothetical protein
MYRHGYGFQLQSPGGFICQEVHYVTPTQSSHPGVLVPYLTDAAKGARY